MILWIIGFIAFTILFLIWLIQKSINERKTVLFKGHLKQEMGEFIKGENLSHWRLVSEDGRQRWFYEDEPVEQTFWEKYQLSICPGRPELFPVPDEELSKNPREAMVKALSFYERLQCDDGHWSNDYGGPLFLLPGAIFTCYITGQNLTEHQKREMIRYLFNTQNKDGGWGIHVESGSTLFGSGLNYVSLRILGVPNDHPKAVLGRQFLKSKGGVNGIPSWGKLWLATLGLYSWDGVSPVIPELWLLPYWVPIHPGRLWCHARMVYLPMAYLYGAKATCPLNPLIKEIRSEIYTERYDSIDWGSLRDECHEIDRYIPTSTLLKLLNIVLRGYERIHNKTLRRWALNETAKHMKYDDIQTKFINIGPVNKAMNMLAMWFELGDGEHVEKHRERLDDYFWLATDGMKMQGYNGCQLWDTSFALLAIAETGLAPDHKECVRKGIHYVDISQVSIDYPDRDEHYHHISKGAWPFSTKDHGWPIADCTSEGLRAAIAFLDSDYVSPISPERLEDAVNVLLSFQNSDEGFPTYELQRAGSWLELMNPSEVFGAIMVDYSYVELTGSVMRALRCFSDRFPDHRKQEIEKAIAGGRRWLLKHQYNDGSWIGSWAVCFTYGTWFGIEALVAACEDPKTSVPIQRAVYFLKSKQNEDGGWGEDFKSCVQRKWVNNPNGSQVVNTAWALLALMAGGADHETVRRGIHFLMKQQLGNGDWKLESISGVFNNNSSISYNSYKNIFPMWALGRYCKLYSEST